MIVPPPLPARRPVLVAHQGAHDRGVEVNSPEAVRRAVELGAPAIEIDVHRLGDGTLVAAHDEEIRVSGRSIPLHELTRETSPLPPVEDLLAELEGFPGMLVFDWKGYELEDRVAGVLRDHDLFERALLTSINAWVLRELRDKVPDLALGLSFPVAAYGQLFQEEAAIAGVLDEVGVGTAALDRRLPNLAELVARVRGEGRAAFLWTAADVASYEQLATLQPDGIMTNAAAHQLRVRPAI